MKKSTRLLSIVLAVLMVISMVPVAVFAETGVVTTLDELKTALNSGATEITVGANIDAAELTISKDVTIDLGEFTLTDAYIIITGKVTIKNGYIKNTNEPYPLVVQNSGVLTIEDVAIEASKSDRAIWVRSSGSLIFNSGSILATKGENNTKTNLIAAIYTDSNTNVTINGGTITVDTPDNKAIGIFGNYTNANVTVNGGKISTSGKNYSYGINVDGDITVNGGEIVTNEKGYGYSSGIRYGNNYALVTATGDVTVTGGTITTNGYSGYMVNVGRTYSSQDQTVTITGGTFSNNLSEVEKTTGGHKPPVLLWEGSASNVTATISGGDFSGFRAALLRGDNTTLSISGGTFDVEVLDVDDDLEKYLAEDANLIEKDGSFIVADSSVTVIGTKEELLAFAEKVNAGDTFAGKTVILVADIDLEKALWTPIGASADSEPKFRGTFDGRDHTIKNLYVKQGAAYHAAGLFGAVNGTVKNLTIDGASIESLSSGSATVNGTAVVAGSTAYGATIENVHVKNATVKGNRYVAGIVGYMDGTVKDCSVENLTVVATPDDLTGSYDNGDKVGGIVGYCNSNSIEISGCELKGIVTLTAYRDVAGIVGCANSTVKVNNNTNNSDLTVVVDQITNSYGEKAANAGEFIGRSTPAESTGNSRGAEASYSQETGWDGLTINSRYQLIKFAEAVNAGNTYSGKTVTLNANIDLSGINWTPIGNVGYNSEYAPADSSKVFSGVFDGNNKVISNLKMSKTAGGADEEANLGLFGITGEGAVIKDLTITNVDIETDGRNVGALVAFAHKATIDNITVNGDIRIKGGNNVSGVCAMSRYNTASVTNITLKGKDGSTIVGNNIVGGIFAEIAPKGAAQTFKNLSVENVAISGVGGVGGLVGLQTGGTVENVSVKDVALTGRTDYQGNAMGRIRLGSVSGLMGGKNATIIGASVDNVTAKNLDGNAVVLPVIGANYDASSNATEAKIGDTYYATLTAALKAVKAGDTVTLLTDVDLNNEEWTPIASFAGTFDGAGHVIKNLKITHPGGQTVVNNVGLFGEIKNGTIKNLTIENVDISGSGRVGAVVGNGYTGTIENVTVTGNVKIAGYQYVGGIAGYGYAKITNCHVIGDGADTSVIKKVAKSEIYGEGTNGYVGGIKGFCGEGNIAVTGCSVENITVTTNDDTVGGISGIFHYGNTFTGNTLKNVKITAPDNDGYNGIIAGDVRTSAGQTNTYEVTVDNVTATADGVDLPALGIGATLVVDTSNGNVLSGKVYSASAAVAKIGSVSYLTINDAVKAAKTGDIVKLLKDVTLTEDDCVAGADRKVLIDVVDKDITLDMNGKKISVVHEDAFTNDYVVAVVRVGDGAGLTVTGNGTIDVKVLNGDPDLAYMFWKRGTTGHLTIENGTYHMNDSADSMIYTNGDEIVTVKGGTFTLDAYGTRGNKEPWIFNVQGAGDNNVIVTGGTFNADINRQHWSNEVVVPETHYTVKNDDDTYTVMEGAVAYVNEGMLTGPYFVRKNIGYATFEEAFAAAIEKKDPSVTLLEDVEISEPIKVTADQNIDLTIDGNGHTLTYTGSDRAIDVTKETNGADLTVKDLKVQAVKAERGINYNTNGTLILKNVEVTAGTYAVNLPAYSDEASVAVSDSKLTAAIALNVWGEDAVINVVDSTLTSVDKSAVENYSAIQLNNNGTDVANGTSVNVIGGELIAQDDSFIACNWSETGKISISNSTKIVMDTTGATVQTTVAIAAGYGFVSLQDAIDWSKENSSSAPIKLLRDIELSESVNVTGTITLDLNGKTIAGTDTATNSFGLINVQPGADLTVKDSVGGGKITLIATNDRDWNAYSSVISNQRGKLTVESGTIEHLGGTDMAYGIDNLTNGKGTYAETVINGGTIKSTYRAIRQFLNGVEAQNILTVNGGTIEGANKSIWMQDPSKNANTGTLTVTENASLKGDVYLYVTPGSTEWPVEVSIAAAAVDGEVITGNVPAGYGLANVNGTYSVCTGEAKIGDIYYDTVEAAVAAAQAGDTIELIANAEIENKINVLADLIIDGNGYTLTYTGSDRAIDVTKETNGADLTVKDLTVDCTASYCQRGINYNTTGTLTLDGVTVKGTNVTYAVNMPAYSNGATVEIKDSDISGCIALNVWGKNVAITANNTVFTSIDKTDAEGYVAIKLNNDVTNVADGTVITVNGGKIVAKDENGAPSTATDNATATGKIIVSDTTEVIGEHRAAVAIVKYIGYNEFYSCYSLQEAIEQAENDPTATVMLLRDLEANEIITIEGAVTIDGNEKTLTSTAGRAINVDTTAAVTIKNLTIVGGTGCERGINIINKSGTTNLEKVDISGVSHYAVHVATSAGAATVNIKDSDLTGYSALAIYGKGTTAKVTGSDLKGVNTYENNAQYPESNNYGAIDVAADDVTVTTEGGTITAVAGGDEWSAYQRILNINARVEKIDGIILDSELVLEGERAEYLCNFSSQGTLSVRDDYADGIVAEGYTTKDAGNGLVNVIYLPELPTATVTELENDDLTFALNFKADEATDEQLAYFGGWYADFVLTVNKDVTFCADSETADGYLSGQYDTWSPNWVNVPFDDVTLKADESLKIMEYAAKLLNQSGLKLTYNDVYTFVKDFDCGVFFTDKFLAENPDLVVTLELRMYNPEDESESYIIGKAREYTAPEVDLVAEVDGVQYSSIQRAFDYAKNGSTITVLKDHTIEKVAVLAAGQTVTLDLNGKTLKAADGIIPMIRVNGNLTVTGEGQMTCASEDAYCFIVGQNVDGNLTKGTLTIKNGTFHAATTVASVTAGTLNVEGGHFSVAPYEGSYAYVLNCIDANYNNGNAEIVVTGGTFANFDPNNNASEGNGTDYVPFGYTSTAKENGTWTVEAGIASYDFPTATVTELDKDDLTFALNFLADEVTDEQLAYFGNWYADFELTLNKDAVFNASDNNADGHLAGEYGSYGWINVPFDAVEMKANESLKIMAYAAELLNQPGLKFTYGEVYELVKDFNCGVFFSDEYLAENPDLEVTLELRMYNPADESESYVIGETYVFEAPIIPVGDAVCVNTNTNEQYDTVAKGLADAKAGETVQLLKNCSEGYVLVTPGVTLDLNGKELTADYVIGFNTAKVIACDRTVVTTPEGRSAGKLIVKKDNVVLDENNGQLPVYDTENGYYLFSRSTVKNRSVDNGVNYFGASPVFDTYVHNLLAAGKDKSGVKVYVRVRWNDNGGTYTATQDYLYNDDNVAIVVNSWNGINYGRMFDATFGATAIEAEEILVSMVVVSDTGAEFESEPIPLNLKATV